MVTIFHLMKTCFKCSRLLPLTEFYPHPQMKDGHLNKCKDCSKKDTADRVAIKVKDPEWLENEMERHRLKQRRYRVLGLDRKLIGNDKKICQEKHKRKYPARSSARLILGNAVRDGKILKQPCSICGSLDSEGHHEDYSKPLDVVWLCPKHHAERHVQIRKEIRRLKALV